MFPPSYSLSPFQLFLRGLPHLHCKMRRKVWKQNDPIVDKNNEPDLYEISRLHPLPPVGGTPQPVTRPIIASSSPNNNMHFLTSFPTLQPKPTSPSPATRPDVHYISRPMYIEPLLQPPGLSLDVSRYHGGYPPTNFQSQLSNTFPYSMDPSLQLLLWTRMLSNSDMNNPWKLPSSGLAVSPYSTSATATSQQEIFSQFGMANNLQSFLSRNLWHR